MTLRSEGFVELLQHRGFVVSSLSASDLRDLYVAEALLAGELSARAAMKVTGADLEDLRQLNTAIDRAFDSGDLPATGRAEGHFHRALTRTAGSNKLRSLLDSVSQYLPRDFYPVYVSIEGWMENTRADHDALLSALAKRRPEEARRVTAHHIIHTGELIVNELTRGNDL